MGEVLGPVWFFYGGCSEGVIGVFGGVDVEGHFVEEFLGNALAFYPEDFEVDFAVCYSSAEVTAESPLVDVHDDGGQCCHDAEDGEDHDRKHPESAKNGVAVS